MKTTKLSTNGRVLLPKSVRDAHGWGPGTNFVIESTPDGVRLRVKAPFAPTRLEEVFGSVRYAGPAVNLQEMDAGIRGAAGRHCQRRAAR